MEDWYSFDDGQSIGQRGSEGGVILHDEEHPFGSRITLERDGKRPFSITCGIYGWMLHTRFFNSEAEATKAFEEMKTELSRILYLIPTVEEAEADATKMMAVESSITRFVELFP